MQHPQYINIMRSVFDLAGNYDGDVDAKKDTDDHEDRPTRAYITISQVSVLETSSTLSALMLE
jgi:hypothetical protein